MIPQRIQRKREAGYNMQAVSVALNGLPCVSVTSRGKWGNPFYIINEEGSPWVSDHRDDSMPALNYDVRRLLGIPEDGPLNWHDARRGVVALFKQQCCDRSFAELRGKNLACWCKPENPCHGAVILELANTPETPRREASHEG